MCYAIGDLVCVILSHIVCVVFSESRVSRWITCDVWRSWWFSVCHTVIGSVCLVLCALSYLEVECRDEMRVRSYVIWITREYLSSWSFCACHIIICSVCLNAMCIVLSGSEVSRWITCDVWRSWNVGCAIVWCVLRCLKVFMCDAWRSWEWGDLVCVILSSGGCVFMSCGLSYLNVECRDEVRVMS